ncbi:universal stress protein [Haladaptatus pallidirubidus]|uniref:Universal stress protein n=1 Tax=Haladaptatus pallidirubidus TaxID=1008152 RepID=A0AAV3URU4_9EURY|nr:universal stress protein [Haladaptatus pallidirubidus]
MYEKILIPTDGSASAEGAIAHGIALANHYGAMIHALYAVELGYAKEDFTDDSVWVSLYEEREQEGERATEGVETKASCVNEAIEVIRSTRHGAPANVILDYVDEHDIDLIAMGTHGRTGVDRYLLGSVTNAVVRGSPIPVLTVRVTEQAQATNYSDILIATDGSPGSTGAIEHGTDIATRYNATVHALYVVDSKYGTSSVVRDMLTETGQEAIEDITAEASSLNLQTEEMVVEGFPHKDILEYAEKHDIDMIVLGTHGRTGLDRFVMGSVAERVVRTAHTPVLTVRSDEQEGDLQS